MLNKVGIYCRLSDEDRFKKDKTDDSESIANQKSMLLKYALSQNWEVINVYSDDDWSGADINRPQFNKLIEDCEKRIINIVLCKTQSRFSRDMEIIEKYIHNKFKEWGVRFVSIIDNADTNIKGNKKTRQINGLINEWYLEDLSDNIRSSLQNKREDGLFLGSFAPYGYMKDPNNKNKLIIDPIASEIVKEIFSLYKSGYGYFKIAEHLNANKIPTPANYKKNNGSKYICGTLKYKENLKWSQDSISKMLKNEVYIGNLVQGKKTYISYKNHTVCKKPKEEWTKVCNTHEPIIDIDTWNIIQAKFNSRTKVSRLTKEVYMLSRKVYCKECGSTFTKQRYRVKEGMVAYIKCKNYKKAGRNCDNQASLRCEIIEKYILDEINKQISLYYNVDELQKEYALTNKCINSSFIKRKEYLNKEKIEIEEKVVKKNNYYQSLYEDKLDDVITKEEFLIFKEKFIKEIAEYQNRLKIIEKELESIKSKEQDTQTSINIFEKYKHIDILTREVVDEFVDVVYVGKLNPKTKERDIDIHLNIINLK